jgi:hypothetical protein
MLTRKSSTAFLIFLPYLQCFMMADELSPSSHGVFFQAFTTDSVIDMTWIETGVDGKQDFCHVGSIDTIAYDLGLGVWLDLCV